MKHREFVLVDPLIPKKCEVGEDFLLHIQKAVLYSLENRKLLTPIQLENCLTELGRRHCGLTSSMAVQ